MTEGQVFPCRLWLPKHSSPLQGCSHLDYNNDGLKDIFIAGNFYGNNIQLGRNDADFGTLPD
jgi:hypothetical protein